MAGNIQDLPEKGTTLRLFFALWPSPALRNFMHDEAVACGQAYGGKVMRKDTLHMTLLFLGDVPRACVAELVDSVTALEKAAFTFQLSQRRCWRHNRIVYLGTETKVAELDRLVMQLIDVAEKAGVVCDKRGFTPHVTLLRKMERPCESGAVAVPEWQVSGFSLVESVPDLGGVHYRDVHAWSCD